MILTAQKRMFDKRITDSDKFTDLPNSSKALYFMAGMSADDRGFFQPRRLQKISGFTDDDFKVLIAKGYFIPFESGVMVITEWNKNNYLDKNRITETEYVNELKMLKLINEKYEINDVNDVCLTDVKPMFNQYSIEENSIEENSIDNIHTQKDKKHKYGEYKNVLLTDDEIEKLKTAYSNYEQLINYLDEYIEMKGYKAKSHYLAIKKWVVNAVKEHGISYEEKPEWFNKTIEANEPTEEERKELEDLLKEYK